MMTRAIRALRIPTTLGVLMAIVAAAIGPPSVLAPRLARGQDNPAVLLPRVQDEETLLREKAVDVLTRVTLERLRSVRNPTREHLRAAALALRIIRRLAPNDPELLRLEIEAWTTAGDDEAALAQTKALLRLDPSDQMAQLRVAIAGLEGLQDVDSRLAAYDRLLGPRGQAIDASVRSRLALDASLLARDNGDETAFLEYLTRAMSLDPTNKAAAALFGSYVLGKSDDPMQRVEVLCNIILSDPLDSGAWENLALELLSRGAYAGALRAYTIATSIAIARGWKMTPERVFDLALCEWRVKSPVQALGRINKVVQDSIIAENQRREAAIAEGLDPGPERPLFLPPELDLMRLAIAVSQKSEEGVKSVLDVFLTSDDLQRQRLENRQDETPEAKLRARAVLESMKLQRLWALLFARQRLDEAQTLFDELVAESAAREQASQSQEPSPGEAAPQPDDSGAGASPGNTDDADEPGDTLPPLAPEVIQRFRGWLAMLNGQDRDAEELLVPLVEHDINARWAMAVLREQQGSEREAMLHFALLAKENPRSALSAAAWYRLMFLRNGPVAPPNEAQALDLYVLGFAPWLNSMALDPASFMSLRVRHEDAVIDPLGVLRVDVTVRNVSEWPLSVGPDRPIPKRLLLAPRLRLKGLEASDLAGPAVALIQNRLRLRPAEEVTVVVTPTQAQFGTLLDLTPGALASIRWQAVQGFTKGSDPGYKAGSMTITTLSDVAVRQPQDTSVGPDEIVARITSLEGAELVRAVQLARREIADAMSSDENRHTARTLMTPITDRLPSMEPLEQAIVLAWLGESAIGVSDEFAPAVRGAIPDPTTYPALALITEFITDAEDPLLQSLIASDDDDLSRLAFTRRELLRAAVEDNAEAPESDDVGTPAASAP